MQMVILVFSVLAFLLGSCAAGEKAWERVGEAGYVQFVLVNKSDEANLAVYEEAIRSLCRPEGFCSLRFWSDKTEVPTSLPMTIAQNGAMTATYLHNPSAVHFYKPSIVLKRFRWNCRVMKTSDCFDYGG